MKNNIKHRAKGIVGFSFKAEREEKNEKKKRGSPVVNRPTR